MFAVCMDLFSPILDTLLTGIFNLIFNFIANLQLMYRFIAKMFV
jgi:hypothetical protein